LGLCSTEQKKLSTEKKWHTENIIININSTEKGMLNGNRKKKGKRTRKNKRPHGEEDKGNAQQADAHAEVEEVVLRTKIQKKEQTQTSLA
jgi:hypothetical protein